MLLQKKGRLNWDKSRDCPPDIPPWLLMLLIALIALITEMVHSCDGCDGGYDRNGCDRGMDLALKVCGRLGEVL
jgi:hypothetical protein